MLAVASTDARAAPDRTSMSPSDAADREIDDCFAQFDSTQDAASVHRALDRVEAAGRDVTERELSDRERATGLWIRFLSRLDRIVDPSWRVDAKPVRGTTPPPNAGPVSGAGEVDPSNIADPAERTRYVEALAASKAYERHYAVQIELHRIDETATQRFVGWLASRYPVTDAERKTVDDAIAASTMSDARKKRLRASLAR